MDLRSNEEIRGDLSFLVDKASEGLSARMATALSAIDLTAREYCVLAKADSGELTQGQIAEIALLDKTTMVVTLDGLERAGLARRVPSPVDRRARLVVTTDEGRRVVGEARVIIDALYADVLGVLAPAQRDVLLDALVLLVGRGGPLADGPQTSAKPRRTSRT
jgi:DNA-binding MarR family transcriptional regulator